MKIEESLKRLSEAIENTKTERENQSKALLYFRQVVLRGAMDHLGTIPAIIIGSRNTIRNIKGEWKTIQSFTIDLEEASSLACSLTFSYKFTDPSFVSVVYSCPEYKSVETSIPIYTSIEDLVERLVETITFLKL